MIETSNTALYEMGMAAYLAIQKAARSPDKIIDRNYDYWENPELPYMERWHLIRDTEGAGNMYLHCYGRGDEEEDLHDHPWPSITVVLFGVLSEIRPQNQEWLTPGRVVRREAEEPHRIELPYGPPAWTLFITGTKCREWGFHAPSGWTHWREYLGIPEDEGT